jgi:hypothetical protein
MSLHCQIAVLSLQLGPSSHLPRTPATTTKHRPCTPATRMPSHADLSLPPPCARHTFLHPRPLQHFQACRRHRRHRRHRRRRAAGLAAVHARMRCSGLLCIGRESRVGANWAWRPMPWQCRDVTGHPALSFQRKRRSLRNSTPQ